MDSSVRKEWLNCSFNEEPDPTLSVYAAHFSVDCFMNLSQCNVRFTVRLYQKNGVPHGVTTFEVILYITLYLRFLISHVKRSFTLFYRHMSLSEKSIFTLKVWN